MARFTGWWNGTFMMSIMYPATHHRQTDLDQTSFSFEWIYHGWFGLVGYLFHRNFKQSIFSDTMLWCLKIGKSGVRKLWEGWERHIFTHHTNTNGVVNIQSSPQSSCDTCYAIHAMWYMSYGTCYVIHAMWYRTCDACFVIHVMTPKDWYAKCEEVVGGLRETHCHSSYKWSLKHLVITTTMWYM